MADAITWSLRRQADLFVLCRILGEQKVVPQDVGFQILSLDGDGEAAVTSSAARPTTATNLTDVTDQDITGTAQALHK